MSEETQIQEILKAWEVNPLLWGYYFFPHHFKKASPYFHTVILKEALKNKRLAIAAPRESAKSTIVSFLLPAHAITFKKKKFIIIVQNTFDKATGTLYTLKKEFKSNELLKSTFPIEITRDTEGDTIFKQDNFETRVLCKGADQIGSVRGEKFGEQRPDLIIIDDVEDDEAVKNPERRIYLQQLFDEVLGKAGAEGEVDIWVIGTILHDDSLLAKLLDKEQYKEYKKVFYKALFRDNKGELRTLWGEKWSVEELMKLRREKPTVFAKEMQNNPVSGALARFKKEQFRYWIEDNGNYELWWQDKMLTKGSLRECKAAIACDLAWKETKETDSTVIMPAYLTPSSFILVGDFITKKAMRPDEFCELIFAMESKLREQTGSYVPIGFEKAMLEKVTQWILKQEMKKRNHWLLTKELKWETDKITRIETVLQPRYAQGAIFHKRGQGDLESQLLRFPSGVHDDIIDGLQGVCRLLEFPKSIKDVEVQIDHFSWLQKQASEFHNPPRKKFTFGAKLKSRPLIKAQQSWR